MKILIAFLLVLYTLGVASIVRPQAAKWKLLEGETYLFVVDCFPSYMSPEGIAPSGERMRANPCYTESLTVKSVSDDGWVEAVDSDAPGLVWRVNLARVYAVSQVPSPNRRSASR